MSRKTLLILVVLFFTVTLTACEKRPKGFPKVYPCQIKVTQEGEPLEAAIVTCIPDNPELKKWVITGKTDADGILTLMTQTYPGAPKGTYKVTVTKMNAVPGEMGIPVPANHVDLVFGDPETTTLTLEVTKNMTEPVVLEVGPDPSE